MNEVLAPCLLTDGEMKKWERIMKGRSKSQEQICEALNDVFEGMFSLSTLSSLSYMSLIHSPDGFEDWGSPVMDEDDHDHAGHKHPH